MCATGDQIVVQRLSSEVTGKAQKYSRIGPREFVPFQYDELFFGNIKEACEKHFTEMVGETIYCDILAGEQGPSCSALDQIPNYGLIHVRFVPHPQDCEDPLTSVTTSRSPVGKKKRVTLKSATQSQPSQLAPKAVASAQYPKSLSVLDMLKLGKVINEKTSTIISLFSFDIKEMAWSLMPKAVEFIINKEPFGSGGFREAFKATSKTPKFKSSVWVIKKYLPDALMTIEQTNQTTEQHTKKVVQMHSLAKNFAEQLEHQLQKKDVLHLYGETVKFSPIFLGKMESGEYVTVENYIDGEFVKYTNNNGLICKPNTALRQKAESLAHFSFEKSEKQLMVMDIQGSGHHLFDPEIASRNLLHEDDDEFLFTTGNLADTAITNLIENHDCSKYCTLLDLPKLK